MSSRWATNPEDNTQALNERKRRKEEKRRQREERRPQHDYHTVEVHPENVVGDQETGRPNKQQRTTSPPQNTVEAVHILEFPISTIQQNGSLGEYEILNSIEEGSYGYVSRARNRDSGDVVALKRLKIEHNNSEGFPVTGLREIETLKACSHAHIVNLREVISDSGPTQDVYLVMDFLEHDLKTLLEDMAEPFLPSETKTLMQQLCSATEYLHANWIIHRDLKTSNILLNNRGQIKLADFGMARYTSSPPPKLTQLVVTLWYRAPELLLGAEEYHFEIDIWSIGCIFAELLTREPLFQGRNEVTQLSAIFNLLGTPTKDNWPTFRSLPNAKALHPLLTTAVSRKPNLTSTKFRYLTTAGLLLLASTLALDPTNRPSASALLAQSYFKEDPRPKPQAMFPTFPSKAGQEKRRRRTTPQAPDRGQEARRLGAEDFANIFKPQENQQKGGGFSLRME